MSRWVGLIGLGLLVAVVGLILVRPGAVPQTDAQRADAIAAELRCPDCAGLSVADSHTAAAVEMRRQIAELVDVGESDAAIRDRFVASYGQWVLLQPSTPTFWVIPLAVAAVGVAAFVAWLVRRRPAVDAPQPPELDDGPPPHEVLGCVDRSRRDVTGRLDRHHAGGAGSSALFGRCCEGCWQTGHRDRLSGRGNDWVSLPRPSG